MIRTLTSLFVAATLLMVVSGCDALTDATTVDVPIDIKVYPQSINPSIPQVDEDCVDLNSIKDYADNKDMIKGGSLQRITFQVTDLQNPSFDPQTAVMQTLDLTLEFDASYGDPKVYNLGSFTDLAFASAYGAPMTVPVTDDAKAVITKILAGREKFCVKASYGPLTSGPASATFLKGALIMTVKFEASVL